MCSRLLQRGHRARFFRIHDKTLEEIQQRIAKLEQEAQLLPPGRVLEAALREIRQLRSLAVAKRWAPASRMDSTRPESAILFPIMPTEQIPICPTCQRPKTLELQPGGKEPRTLQCLDCERPDPLKPSTRFWTL
jgi:hypothetical protein